MQKSKLNGIGTKNRKWYTGEQKNIAMTIVKKPMSNISKFENITIKIANAISEMIKNKYSIELKIKEPNDLMLNNKKVCGILTEISTQKNIVNTLLISIGLNVNEENFDKETRQIATSLKKETGRKLCREKMIIDIVNELEKIEGKI